jgi:hypothetical protein
MQNAVSYMNDPNLYFVSSASWFTGNGNVAAPTGNGNSDIYGSSDGVHPTDWGNQYIAQQVANALRGLFPTVPPPIRDATPARDGTAVAGCGFPMQTTAPTAAQIGGVVGSVTNHLMVNVGGALIDYWSDGTTLYSRQLAP